MKVTQQLLYAFGIAVCFLLTHILMASLELGDVLNLIFSLALMLIAQLCGFFLLKRSYPVTRPPFKNSWGMLCVTQIFSIILLTLNSAFNPLIKNEPIQLTDVLISLIIFGVLFPLILTTIIWFIQKRKTN